MYLLFCFTACTSSNWCSRQNSSFLFKHDQNSYTMHATDFSAANKRTSLTGNSAARAPPNKGMNTIYIHVYMYVYIYIYININSCINIYIRTHRHTQLFTKTRSHSIYLYIFGACAFINIYAYVCVCIYIYIYIYINTHTPHGLVQRTIRKVHVHVLLMHVRMLWLIYCV
jgi:hypothetical protein